MAKSSKFKATQTVLPSSTTTASWNFENPSITINGADNKPILEISYEGKVIWHAEDQASEAARIFCENLHIGVEQCAGIKQSRKEWEHERYVSVKQALDAGELTVEKLAEIFKKHDFISKLAGKDID